MKTLIQLVVFILILTGANAQTDSIKGNQFQLKGKIINEIYLTPGCGVFAWGTVIEFEIIEFSKPGYSKSSVGIIVTCPEFLGESFFENGKVYHLTVADENQATFDWVIPNEERLEKYGLEKNLWMIDAEKIN